MAKGQKTDLRERKVAKTHFKVRVAGETSSQQNALRHELYTHIYERLEEANEQAMYFEIIALCDMLITDRLEALTQYLLHYEDKEYKTDSIGLALQYLGTAINDKKPALKNDDDYKQIYKRVDEFAKMRNEVMHGFILVKNVASDISLNERLEFAEHTAEVGNKLIRDVSEFVSKQTKIKD